MAQYTEQQLKQALRKAVDAGDDEAAQFFASEIDAVRKTAPKEKQPDSFLDTALAGAKTTLAGLEGAAIGLDPLLRKMSIPHALAGAVADKFGAQDKLAERAADVGNRLSANRQVSTGNGTKDALAKLPSALVDYFLFGGAGETINEADRQINELGVTPEQAQKSGVRRATLNAIANFAGPTQKVFTTMAKTGGYNVLADAVANAADTQTFAGNEKAVEDAQNRLFSVEGNTLNFALGAGAAGLGKLVDNRAKAKAKAVDDAAIMKALESGSLEQFVKAYTKANPKASPKEVVRVYQELAPEKPLADTTLGAGTGEELRTNPTDIQAPDWELSNVDGRGSKPLQDMYTNDSIPYAKPDPEQLEMNFPWEQANNRPPVDENGVRPDADIYQPDAEVLPYNTKEQAEVLAQLRNSGLDNTIPRGTQLDLIDPLTHPDRPLGEPVPMPTAPNATRPLGMRMRRGKQGGWIGGESGLGKKHGDAFSRADQMRFDAGTADGVGMDDMYNATGVYYGKDGKLRMEVPDPPADSMKFNMMLNRALEKLPTSEKNTIADILNTAKNYEGNPFNNDSPRVRMYRATGKSSTAFEAKTTLGELLLDDDALFEAYPSLRDIDVSFEFTIDPFGDKGSATSNKITVRGNDRAEMYETLRHEIQHLIQNKEGFARGTNTLMAGSFDNYWKSAGETEARNVSRRLDKNVRNEPPYRTEDVPQDQQIVSYGFGKAKSEEISIGGIPERRVPDGFESQRIVPLKNGKQAILEYDIDTNTITAYDPNTGGMIGTLKPAGEPGITTDKTHIGHIETRADMRGNGVATAMKDMFSDLFNGNIGPSNVQTADGRAWGKRVWGKQQSGMFAPFADNKFEDLGMATRSIEEYGNKKNKWVKKAAEDLKLPEAMMEAVWTKHKQEQKNKTNPNNISTTTPTAAGKPNNTLEAIAAQKVISDTRPWEEAKADVLAATPDDFGSKKIGVLGHKQMGTLYGGLTKWTANQLSKAASEVQAWSRKIGYGQYVQMKGMPVLKHSPDAPMPALQALSKKDLSALAEIVTSDEFRNAPARLSTEELMGMGMNKQAAEAWTKINEMHDAYYDKLTELLTAAGREKEIPERRPNYVPEKIIGDYVITATGADGRPLGIYSLDSKFQAKQKRADIIADLQARGFDTATVNISAPRKKSSQFVMPANEAYRYMGTQFKGTGVKGYFKENQGKTRIAVGENAGADLVGALEMYATKMDQLFTAMVAKQQLEPMLHDPEVNAKFPNISDWAAREAATIGGQRRDGGVFTNINDYTNGHLSKIMSGTNQAFNLMKVVGNPIRFMYNAAMNGALVLPARAEFIKAQTGAQGSWVLSSGKAVADMWSMLTKNGVSPETRSALQWLGEQGMLDQSFLKAALHLDAPGYKTLDKVYNKIGQGIDILNRPEHWNRAHMFLTFDNMLKDVIPDQQKRWRTAAEQATEAMVDMSSQGRSLMFKENDPLLMSTISPLKSFIMNDYGQLLTYLKSVKDSPNMRGKIMPITNYVVTRLALGGLVSTVGIHEYDAVVGLINSEFGTDYPTFEEMFADKPWAVSNGIPSGITGLDLSGAAQPFSVVEFPVAPQLVWLKRGAEDVARAFKTRDVQDLRQATKTLGPSIAGQVLDKKRAEVNADRVGGDEVILNRRGTEGTVSADTITNLSQLTGIRSKERVQAERTENVLKTKEMQYQKQTASAMDKAFRGHVTDDYDLYMDAVESLQTIFDKTGDDRDPFDVLDKYIESRLKKQSASKADRDYEDDARALKRDLILEGN